MTALQRRYHPETGSVFCIVPFSDKLVGDRMFPFDEMYAQVLAKCIEMAGMTPSRLDTIYGQQGMRELIWDSVQKAELLIVDFTGRSANVAYELGMATVLNKRFISITQDENDIPSDIRGQNRFLKYSADAFGMRKFEGELVAQLEALRQEPADEMSLVPLLPGTETVAATIVDVQTDYALVRTVEGKLGILKGADVDYGKIVSDMHRRFRVGAEVQGAFVYDIARMEPKFTLLAGQENPWGLVASKYPIGSSLTARVTSVAEHIGAFVRVLGPVTGLVPRSTMGTEPLPEVGTDVEVTVTHLDTTQRKITLQLKHTHTPTASVTIARPALQLPTVGDRFVGTVTRTVPEANGRGGYALLKLAGYPRPAMLHAKHMEADLRADLNDNQIANGDEIDVEVVSVDPTTNRVLLRDLGEEASEEAAEPAGSAPAA